MNLIDSKVDAFFSKFRIRKFEKGHILVMAGEDPEGIIYLIKGEIGQYDITDQGQKNMVNVFKSKSFFPMSWAINSARNEYFYEAITDVEYRICPPEEVVDFVKDKPDVLFDLLSRVYKGTDVLLKRTAHLMSGKASTRVAFELQIACYRSRKIIDDRCEIGLSETDLATRTGLSRETVNREIQKLKAKNIVEVNKSGIKVISLKKLEESIT